jgi:hypothetical protein
LEKQKEPTDLHPALMSKVKHVRGFNPTRFYNGQFSSRYAAPPMPDHSLSQRKIVELSQRLQQNQTKFKQKGS